MKKTKRKSKSSVLSTSPRRASVKSFNATARWVGTLFLCLFFVMQIILSIYLLCQFNVFANTSFNIKTMLQAFTRNETTKSGPFSGLKRRSDHRWDPGRDGLKEPAQLKINSPIFVASLSKSGTTSIWQYFNCGGHSADHQWVKKNDSVTEYAGLCFWKNIRDFLPVFEGCGTKNIYTDTSFARFPKNVKDESEPLCYFPSIDALDAIYESYPDFTLILVARNTSSWYNSMATWGNGTLLQRLEDCHPPNYPSHEKANAASIMRWYDWHNDHVRKFAVAHPTLRYIEVELEAKDTGIKLEEQIGIPAMCWGKCHPLSKFCTKVE